jgi:hypothetical protein
MTWWKKKTRWKNKAKQHRPKSIRLNVERLEERETPAIGLSASAYSVAENAGTLVFTINRDDTTQTATLNYAVTDGTAIAGRDYSARTNPGSNNPSQTLAGSLSFGIGEASKTVTVRILDNDTVDTARSFNIGLSGLSGGLDSFGITSATAAITDFEAGKPVLSAISPVNEDAGTVAVTVNRVGGSNGTLTVNYSTVDGTALAGVDYTATSGTLTWLDGDTAPQVFNVPILNDNIPEATKTFQVSLGLTALGGSAVTAPSVLWNFDSSSIIGATTTTPTFADQATTGATALNLVNTSRALGGTIRGSYRFTEPAPFSYDFSDGTAETAIVPSGATFAGAGQAYELQSGIAKILVGANITNATWSGGVATFTTQTPHNLQANTRVRIGDESGANHGISQINFTGLFNRVIVTGGAGGNYNGNFTVASVIDANTFTVPIASDPGTYVSGGAVNSNATQGPIWVGTQSYIAAPITTSQTTITVGSNVGFPTGSGELPFYIQLGTAAYDVNGVMTSASATEIAQVTAISGNVWTIRRNVSSEFDGQSKPTGTYSNSTILANSTANSNPASYGVVTLAIKPSNGVVDTRNIIYGRTAYRDLLAPFQTNNNTTLPTGLATDARFTTDSRLNSKDGAITYSLWMNMPVLNGADFNVNQFIQNGANRTILLGRSSAASEGGNFGGVLQTRTVPHYSGILGGTAPNGNGGTQVVTQTVTPDSNGDFKLLVVQSTAAWADMTNPSVTGEAGILAGTTASVVNNNTLQLSQEIDSFTSQTFRRVTPAAGSATIDVDTITVTVASTSSFRVGDAVSGTGIPGGTTIASIVNGTTLTLNQAATAGSITNFLVTAPSENVVVSKDGSGDFKIVTVSSTTSFQVGDTVSGTDIPAGTTIVAIDSVNNKLTLSQAPTSITIRTMTVDTGYNPSDKAGTVKYTFQLRVDNTGSSASLADQIPHNSIFKVGEWNHWAVTYDRLETRVYKNGVLTDTLAILQGFDPAATKGVVYESAGVFRLNNVGYSGAGLQEGGVYQIDDLGVFRTSLSGTDITAIYNNGLKAAVSNVATVTILDTDPPVKLTNTQIGTGAQRSTVRSITLTFNGPVSSVSPGAIQVTDQSNVAIPGLSLNIAGVGTNVLTITFVDTDVNDDAGPVTYQSLADGLYRLTIDGSLMTAGNTTVDADGNGTAGGISQTNFHRLYGDVNGDAFVDLGDIYDPAIGLVAALNTGVGDPGFDPAWDYNNDGFIDFADIYDPLINRLNTGL